MVGNLYERRDFGTGPATYSDENLVSRIYGLIGFEQNKKPLVIADLMSGPGNLGQRISERATTQGIHHVPLFLDRSQVQIERIPPSYNRVVADALHTPFAEASVDVALVRYAVKDTPEDKQLELMKQIKSVMKSGGKLIFIDMVELPDSDGWINKLHSLKQQFGGRDINKEGECCIRDESGWIDLFKEAGFHSTIEMYSSDSKYYRSHVTTEDWLNGKQFTGTDDEQLFKKKEIDTHILKADDTIKKRLDILEIENKVHISFPVILMTAYA